MTTITNDAVRMLAAARGEPISEGPTRSEKESDASLGVRLFGEARKARAIETKGSRSPAPAVPEPLDEARHARDVARMGLPLDTTPAELAAVAAGLYADRFKRGVPTAAQRLAAMRSATVRAKRAGASPLLSAEDAAEWAKVRRLPADVTPAEVAAMKRLARRPAEAWSTPVELLRRVRAAQPVA